jgi:F-type H+-transporting ATPase subunit gamma
MAESLIDVKGRINSTKKTSQITKAMYMVSSSKVKRSQQTYYSYQDFLNRIRQLVVTTLNNTGADFSYPMFEKREVKTTAYLLISSDTGLAGPYNTNVFKHFEQLVVNDKTNYLVWTIGKKSYSYVKSKGHPLINTSPLLIRDDVQYIDIVPIAKQIVHAYLTGEIDKIVIVYNHFVNSLNIEVKDEILLPIEPIVTSDIKTEYLFEGGILDIVDEIMPMYIQAVVYGIILDAKISEHSSRMNAMKNATDNATEVIDKLQILYNRARQSAITTELIDIIAGANAVE